MALHHTPSHSSSSTTTTSHGWLDEALALLDGYDAFGTPAVISAESALTAFAPMSFALDGDVTVSTEPQVSVTTAFNKVQHSHQLQFQHQFDLQREEDPVTESSVSSSSSVSPKSTRRSRAEAQSSRNTPVTKRPRKLPRAEIIRLRGEVETLTAHLDKLQQAKDERANRSNDDQLMDKIRELFPSINPADIQLKALRKSESLNKKLKRQLAEQATLHTSLQTLLRELSTVQNLDIIHEFETPESLQLVQIEPFISDVNENPAAVLAQLRCSVQKLNLETKRISEMVSASSDVRSAFNHSKTTGDLRGRPVFEIMANTPADCGFEQLARQSWAIMMRFADTNPMFQDSKVTKLSVSDTTHEKYVSTRIKCGTTVVELNGLSVVTKFKNPDYIAFIFSSLLTISGIPDLVLREHGWMIATHNPLVPPGPGSYRKSVFQTLYRQTPETRTGVAFAKDNPTAHIQECVMKAQNDRMRSCVAMLQNTLLSELRDGVAL